MENAENTSELSGDAALQAAIQELEGSNAAAKEAAEAESAPAPEPEAKAPESTPEAKLAPDTVKRLEELAAREEKERMANLIKERDELKAKLQAPKTEEPAQEKFDLGVLRQLINNPDEIAKRAGLKDGEALAKAIWAKKLGEDAPQDVTVSESFLQLQERLESLENENKSFREQIESERREAQQRAKMQEFQSTLENVVDDSFEHVPHFIKNKKAETLQEALLIADELTEKLGTQPSAERVMRELDLRLDKARDAKIAQLREELSLWERKQDGNGVAMNGTPGKMTPTLTSEATGVTDKTGAPKTVEERMAEAIATLKSLE